MVIRVHFPPILVRFVPQPISEGAIGQHYWVAPEKKMEKNGLGTWKNGSNRSYTSIKASGIPRITVFLDFSVFRYRIVDGTIHYKEFQAWFSKFKDNLAFSQCLMGIRVVLRSWDILRLFGGCVGSPSIEIQRFERANLHFFFRPHSVTLFL